MRMRPQTSRLLLISAFLLILSGCSSNSDTENAAAVDLLDDDAAASPTTAEPAEPAEPVETTQPIEPTLEELGAPVLGESLNDSQTSFITVLEDVVADSLEEMNARLQTGEALDPVQSTCLGTYDPAIGEALLAIDCGAEQLPISVPNFSMLLTSASVAGTADCNAGLLSLDGNDCRLVSADLLMPVEWQVVDGSLPRPYASGFMEYNLEPNQLRIFSLDDPVTGIYDCTFDLSAATVESASTFGNCNAELDRLTLRLQAWLDRR